MSIIATRREAYLRHSEMPWSVRRGAPLCAHWITGANPRWNDPDHRDECCLLSGCGALTDHPRGMPRTPAGRVVVVQPYVDMEELLAWALPFALNFDLVALPFGRSPSGTTSAVALARADAPTDALMTVAERLRTRWNVIHAARERSM